MSFFCKPALQFLIKMHLNELFWPWFLGNDKGEHQSAGFLRACRCEHRTYKWSLIMKLGIKGVYCVNCKNPFRKKGIVFNFDRLLNDRRGFYFHRLPLFSSVHAKQTEYDTLCSLMGITNAARHRNKQTKIAVERKRQTDQRLTASDIRAGRVALESSNRWWECAEDKKKKRSSCNCYKINVQCWCDMFKGPILFPWPVFYNNKSASSLSVNSSGISPSFTSPDHSTHTESVC